MRAANQCCAALDAPSTSGRCVFPHSRVPGPQRQRHRTWQLRAGGNTSTHNELELHGAQPLPGFKPPPPAGVVPGARTTATPLLSPDRVRGQQGAVVVRWRSGGAQITSLLLPRPRPGSLRVSFPGSFAVVTLLVCTDTAIATAASPRLCRQPPAAAALLPAAHCCHSPHCCCRFPCPHANHNPGGAAAGRSGAPARAAALWCLLLERPGRHRDQPRLHGRAHRRPHGAQGRRCG
jgi:hypothetical protein